MDPDENLAEQRRLAAEFLEPDSELLDIHRLAELVIALDEWIAGGGFLPAAWQKGR